MAESGRAIPSARPDGGSERPARPGPQAASNAPAFQVSAPKIDLPKGGGAIRGIGEKFTANPATGSGSFSIPIEASPGRANFGPQLSLQYDSSAGNGPFGYGWSIALPSIRRKTDKGLPQYNDTSETDTFILAGAEDLVPLLRADGSRYVDTTTDPGYTIRRYRPRVEAHFDRIERWTANGTGETHWRTLSRDNILTIFGRDSSSRVADPRDDTRVFTWLISEMRDDKGNAVVFDYKPEDGAGVEFGQIAERNRGAADDARRKVQRYLKSIRYGNRNTLLDVTAGSRPRFVSDDARTNADWMFEIVFDYGEHDANSPTPDDSGTWFARNDPHSSYRGGFEVRTYRLCQRILMFHHFPQDPKVRHNCLVRSIDIGYRSNRGIPDDVRHGNPTASFIANLKQCGYVRVGAAYLKKALPPLDFQYSEANLRKEVQQLEASSLAHMPIGMDTTTYKWVDLDGEGISGVLTEQAGNWFFKRNRGEGRFAAAESVNHRPATAALTGAHQQLLDLNGDGRLELAEFSGASAGFFERTADEHWEPFRPFAYLPSIPWDEPNLKFVDLNGDGLADVLISEQEVFTWYPSLGDAGFAPARKVQHVPDEERAPHVLLSDGTQSIVLADMSGDGLSDLVRIRSGEVCYWPNLGYGRFGKKVSMDNAPRFERMEQFDGRRLRLADLDGSGTTDLVYLGVDGVSLYFNQSGNRWSAPSLLEPFPKIDNLAAVSVVDLLGKGTMCLVWSSPLPHESRTPLRFIDLLSEKPHLLTKCVNNLGAETVIGYAPSTRFYLEDRDRGRPWVTRLPFPVHVVERVETYDRVSRNRFVSRYSYHHGYFDGVEREFRGFGRVDQFDTEELGATSVDGAFPHATNIEAASYVPPVQTKTWFHTGAFIGGDRVSRYYAAEYYREGNPNASSGELGDAQFEASLLEDSALPSDLSAREMREGCRALRGQILRQEIYALDETAAATRPYSVSERNYSLTLLQTFGPNQQAVFMTHARETIDCHYERALYLVGGNSVSDPRVTHSMLLEVDAFGNEVLSASIAYGRRHDDPDPLLTAADRIRQKQTLATATKSLYTNVIDLPDSYRAPLPAEARTFELVKLGPPASTSSPTPFFTFVDLRARWDQAADGFHDLPYEDLKGSGAVQNVPYRRLIECVRHLYRADNLTSLLPTRTVQSLALPGAAYKLALTPGLLGSVFQRANGAATASLIPNPAATLGDTAADAGGYVDADGDGHWWIPSARVFYDTGVNTATPAMSAAAELSQARQNFFLPRLFVDPFGNGTEIDYDVHKLLVVATRDPMKNSVLATNDYRVLQPALMTDPNGNRCESAFDALGLVAGTAVKGKTDDVGDSLQDFVADLSKQNLNDFFADPSGQAATWLNRATSRFVYDVERYADSGAAASPVYAATIVREQHVSDVGGGTSLLQTSFSYSDGLGREIQQKRQAEKGKLTPTGPVINERWVGSGWAVFNNKGKPARQYEPFFDDTHDFKFGDPRGVSRVLFYDPPGRLVATLHPDQTWEKIVFDPWRQTSWDANDTVAIAAPTADPEAGPYLSRLSNVDFSQTWLSRRIGGALGADEQDAATKAALHAATPTVTCFDTLGRTFLTIADNGEDAANNVQKYVSRTDLDIEGNVRTVWDALDRIVMTYDYDMLGTRIHQSSMEAAERWMLNDVAGKVIRSWDSRRQTFRTAYDALRRPTETSLSDDVQRDIVIARTVYGEVAAKPEDSNLRGRVYQQFDQAGIVTNESYDFKGNLQSTTRELAVEYRSTLDWSKNVPRDGEIHRTVTFHDALNRPSRIEAPDGSLVRPGYNQANLLERVDVRLPGTAPWTPFVSSIDYDPKGQRSLIVYGNDAETRYTYDEETFRLRRLLTTCPASSGGGGVTESVQDLNYAFDPAGNITFIRDDAQQPIFFRNRKVEPNNDYTYDAIYRLIRAKGREHLGRTGGQVNSPTAYGADEGFRINLDHRGDGKVVGTYDESYSYDRVGNILELLHAGTDPAHPGWTRTYRYNEPSLIEPGKKSNRLSTTTVGAKVEPCLYEGLSGVHGNMTSMWHLQVMQWDFHDQLRATARQKVNSGAPETTWYVYDSAGQRVRKITDYSAPAGKEPDRQYERIYIGGFEIYREYAAIDGSKDFERTTLHVMDDKQRIALVEIRTTPANDASQTVLTRYQLGNHLGSASLELDEHATTISYEEYFPYGSTSYQAVNKAIKAAAKRYRHTGMERDEENGFSYHGGRYQATWLGRWISCDPKGLIDGPNIYLAVRNSPIRFTDSDGYAASDGSGRNPAKNYQVGVQEGEQTFAAKLEATGQELLKPFRKAGPGGSATDIRTWVRSLEHKVLDISTKSYRLATNALKESHVARVFRRFFRQAARHQVDLAEAGIKNLSTGAPLKETVVALVKGARDEAEIRNVLAIARKQFNDLNTAVRNTLKNSLKVGVRVEDSKALIQAGKSAEGATAHAVESGAEHATEKLAETAVERSLLKAVAKSSVGKVVGKTLSKVPIVGIAVAAYFVNEDLARGDTFNASLDALGPTPLGVPAMAVQLAVPAHKAASESFGESFTRWYGSWGLPSF